MDLAAAVPTLVFRRRATLERLVLDPELEIGAGGEAVVYEIPGDAALVAKLYHQPGIERARKLSLMMENPPAMPGGTCIAWPADLLLDPRGFAGFLMPRAEGPRLFEFYNPVSRRATAPAFHFGLMLRAGRNLAAAFHALHAAGYVVGDVNESNILVSPFDAGVTLVDADSLQVRDAEAGTTFRSRVGKAEFTPPELQGVSFGEVDRAPEHDRFGLGVLLFLLLMEGTHPFAARMEPGAEAVPVEERIRRGLFPHAREDDGCHPPRMSPRFEALHPELRALFARCFVQGHADPAARPAPGEWCAALETAEAALAECGRNPLHRHSARLEACPWCERAALLGGRDPFPAAAARVPVQVRPRPRRVRMAPPPHASADPAIAPPRYGGRAPMQGLTAYSGPPAPAVFGPSGLRNPLVFGLSSAVVMAVSHGYLAFVAVLACAAALGLLMRGEWRNIRVATVALAVCSALFVGALVGLGTDGDPYDGGPSTRYDPDPPPFTVPAPPYQDPPVIVDPVAPPLSGAEAGQEGPPGVPSRFDVMVGDLYSQPVTQAGFNPGPLPAPRDGTSGLLFPAEDTERLPVLDNATVAGHALAAFYHARVRVPQKADTAMLWLHVGANGMVTDDGSQLIRSTSRAAAQAALATVPYLRYDPAVRGGNDVGVWITQRMVIVP